MSSLNFRAVFAIFLVLHFCDVLAEEPTQQKDSPYQRARAALGKVLGGEYSKYIQEVTAGDLNNDGVEDLSILILKTIDAPQIAILFGSSDGYKLGAISKRFCWAKYHYNLEVRAQSLFLMTVHTLKPSDHTYQFAMRNNELVLIGLEETNFENDQTDGYGKSVNYLTHQVIYWRHTGHKRREVKKPIAKSPLIPLSGFDCESFEEPGGWIKDDFSFEP